MWVELSLQNQNPYCSAVIVSHLVMRMNKQVKEDTPIEDRLEAVEDTVGNTVQSGLS